MASNNRWQNVVPVTGALTTDVHFLCCLDYSNALYLSSFVWNTGWSAFWAGSPEKYVHSIMFYPFNLLKGNGETGYLKFLTDRIAKPNGGYMQAKTLGTQNMGGYTLGEFYYEPLYNDFRDYEPYSKCEVWLPYYGKIELPIKEIIGQYIQFRLNVDFASGKAMYIIGVNRHEVSAPDAPYRSHGTTPTLDDSTTRIISKISFTLGTPVPFTSTNFAETLRNIALGVFNFAGNTAMNMTSNGTTANTTEKVVNTQRNVETGRQITMSTQTTQQTKEVTRQGSVMHEAFDNGLSTLGAMHIYAHSENALGSGVDYNTNRSIKIVIHRAKVKSINDDYKRLYGLPLGETKTLSELSGYTDISSIHLDDSNFNNATKDELDMLHRELTSGIIL